MEIVLKRIAKIGTYTIGRLYLLTDASVKRISQPGKKVRKVTGHTAIPEDSYPVVLAYSPRFKRWLPLLFNYLQHIFNIYGKKACFLLRFLYLCTAIERTVFLCQQSVINDDHKMCRKRLSGEL